MRPKTELIPYLVDRGFEATACVKPAHAREIESSPWSIGCETTDRGYVDFRRVVPHLGELGAKHVRIQAGWAACDRGAGQPLTWESLDFIVDSALREGVQPWLQTSYGNPAYPGGGGIGLSQGIPTSAEALAAWDRWVLALVERYRDRVSTWEIWNESSNWRHDLSAYAVQPEDFARFHARTARLIRKQQPDACIVALALGGHDGTYAPRFFDTLRDLGGPELLDEVCIHGYPHNPDENFDSFADYLQVARAFAPQVTLRQGETGANSECGSGLALGKVAWSERKQAVWNLRRMLAHHARGIPMNLFQLADMYYEKTGGALFDVCNTKGLLRILPDKSVAYRKPAYFAAQHVFTLFDGRLPLQALSPWPIRGSASVSAWCWQQQERPVILAWWNCGMVPELWTQSCGDIGIDTIPVADPVLVDLLSGVVLELPEALRKGEREALHHLPVFDSPIALVRRDYLETTPYG